MFPQLLLMIDGICVMAGDTPPIVASGVDSVQHAAAERRPFKSLMVMKALLIQQNPRPISFLRAS